MGTRFKDTPPTRATSAASNKRDRDILHTRIAQLEGNFNVFIAAVQDVTFNVDAADAKGWMADWQANLLSGIID